MSKGQSIGTYNGYHQLNSGSLVFHKGWGRYFLVGAGRYLIDVYGKKHDIDFKNDAPEGQLESLRHQGGLEVLFFAGYEECR